MDIEHGVRVVEQDQLLNIREIPVERLTYLNTVSLASALALMTVNPIRSSDNFDYLALARYFGCVTFVFGLGGVVGGQCFLKVTDVPSPSRAGTRCLEKVKVARWIILISTFVTVTALVVTISLLL
ncbi:hypothetical protein FRC03_001187 [Tulasnella sp. 419]|nr:hypothetical protein FRC03_001187 [Tulasnella sp. 419]